ncbi:hypothetical protein GCM10023083_75280 [Streptomyces phyllanthi]
MPVEPDEEVRRVEDERARIDSLERGRAALPQPRRLHGLRELGQEAGEERYDGIRLVEDSLDIETCEGAATIGLELVDTARRSTPS